MTTWIDKTPPPIKMPRAWQAILSNGSTVTMTEVHADDTSWWEVTCSDWVPTIKIPAKRFGNLPDTQIKKALIDALWLRVSYLYRAIAVTFEQLKEEE